MTKKLVFMPSARLEVIEAQDWYEKEKAGLGAEFRAEIDHQVARILENPLQFPRMLADVHRAKLRRFPYGLFFRLSDEVIYVIACFHSSRNPIVWQSRV
jgi:plasmid stabilization system protein ParE